MIESLNEAIEQASSAARELQETRRQLVVLEARVLEQLAGVRKMRRAERRHPIMPASWRRRVCRLELEIWDNLRGIRRTMEMCGD